MTIEVKNEVGMKVLGESIGRLLHGGEIIELIGDVGSGKTTFVKGTASGLGVDEYVQSPSFTINRLYKGRHGKLLSHYDFYRLDNAGIMASELQEVINDPSVVTIIEWGNIVEGALPKDRMSIQINVSAENSRQLEISSGGDVSRKIADQIKS